MATKVTGYMAADGHIFATEAGVNTHERKIVFDLWYNKKSGVRHFVPRQDDGRVILGIDGNDLRDWLLNNAVDLECWLRTGRFPEGELKLC